MFEVGFIELMMIMVIALLVVGPERLPGMARKAGALISKMRRFVSNVKQDIDKEIKADELKKIIQDQADSVGIHDIIEETRQTFEKAETEYNTDQPQSEDEKVVKEALKKQDSLSNESINDEAKSLNAGTESNQASQNSINSKS